MAVCSFQGFLAKKKGVPSVVDTPSADLPGTLTCYPQAATFILTSDRTLALVALRDVAACTNNTAAILRGGEAFCFSISVEVAHHLSSHIYPLTFIISHSAWFIPSFIHIPTIPISASHTGASRVPEEVHPKRTRHHPDISCAVSMERQPGSSMQLPAIAPRSEGIQHRYARCVRQPRLGWGVA